MSRNLRRLALPAAALILAAAGCSSTTAKSSSSPTTPPSSTTAPSMTTAPGSTPGSMPSSTPSSTPAAAAQIVIDNFAFSPMNLTVQPGQTVTVVNHDSVTHTLTATSGNAFDTGAITPGKSVTFKAPATAGSYPYVCTIHAQMQGTLTVG